MKTPHNQLRLLHHHLDSLLYRVAEVYHVFATVQRIEKYHSCRDAFVHEGTAMILVVGRSFP